MPTEGPGFKEDAASQTVADDARERETAVPSAGRHLTPSEQRAFGAALRRSVQIISGGASRAKQP
jgi:hypothetical protein